MKKVIAFGASNSQSSINQQLAIWAANQLKDVDVEVIDLNDYEMPIYSIDRENEGGIPELAKQLKARIQASDGIVISLAEHNGCFSAAFKNIIDWVSRIERSLWSGKAVFLMATSPGPRGGAGVLELAAKSFPYQGAKVAGTFSLPGFHQHFAIDEGIKDAELLETFSVAFENFKTAIHHEEAEATTTGA